MVTSSLTASSYNPPLVGSSAYSAESTGSHTCSALQVGVDAEGVDTEGMGRGTLP